MAACYRLSCNRCDYAVEIWDEGNPYAQDWRGRRWFIYHPHLFEGVVHEYERHEGRFVSQEEKEQLLRHCGNASEHVCLTCGRITWIDPRSTRALSRFSAGGATARLFRDLRLSGRLARSAKQALSRIEEFGQSRKRTNCPKVGHWHQVKPSDSSIN